MTVKPEAILFDLGGVIYDIDYQKTIDAFIALGADPKHVMYSQAMQSNLFDAYEIGQISSSDFLIALQKEMPVNTSLDSIKNAWNALLIGQPAHRLTFLAQLKAKLPIFLLSNTNEIHIAQISNELQMHFGEANYKSYFDEVFLSYELGMRKPHVETFQEVIRRTGVNPAKTLFIDDSAQHIEGAQQAGLLTHHHTSGEVIDVLTEILV
jgi:FMN phosphatase YigB (HAD superfamily)